MAEIDRAFIERRSGRDRRRKIRFENFFFRGSERRKACDRRNRQERRSGWIRISKWSSAPLARLKLGKFLKKFKR